MINILATLFKVNCFLYLNYAVTIKYIWNVYVESGFHMDRFINNKMCGFLWKSSIKTVLCHYERLDNYYFFLYKMSFIHHLCHYHGFLRDLQMNKFRTKELLIPTNPQSSIKWSIYIIPPKGWYYITLRVIKKEEGKEIKTLWSYGLPSDV